MTSPQVGILMGSKNDFETLKPCCDVLAEFGIEWEARVLSAHRTPDAALDYATTAEARGLQVIICAAGGAAHLGGFIAAKTVLPVLAVPIASTPLGGLDSLLAMVQMPAGIPVGTLAIGKWGATNAGVLAVQIIATKRTELRDKMRAWRAAKADAVLAQTLP
ncbi:MAG TPA: 5-(carboxyamino)imidazole ribonucleotide mutase [Gemmatimonadaceae bacterium]|nr:5-(carboxyamino)imidazole ribonucleotide mutase [Gemmatimonadaceae bacterium]